MAAKSESQSPSNEQVLALKNNLTLTIAATLLLHLMFVTPPGILPETLVSLLTLAALLLMASLALPLIVATFFLVTLPLYLPPVASTWPVVHFLVPVVLTMIVCLPSRTWRQSSGLLKVGSLRTPSWKFSIGSILLIGLASAGALIAWGLWTDRLTSYYAMIQPLLIYKRSWLFAGVVPAFALLNAFAEELFYRGILQSALDKQLGEKSGPALVLQASAFAIAHFAGGFPSGKVGFAMVFVYGLALGELKRRTKGWLAPYLAHVIADLTIGYFLLEVALTSLPS